MARAIRCGECGAANPLSTQVGETTQGCQKCGVTIVIPPRAQSRRASDRPPRRASDRPPRRTPPPVPINNRSPQKVQAPPPVATSSAATPAGPRSRPWWLRILAWVIALPLALIIIGIPARAAGYLTGQKLLDVIIKQGLSRFFPVLLIILLWSITTVILVTLIVEIGSVLLARRRTKRTNNYAAAPKKQMSRTR